MKGGATVITLFIALAAFTFCGLAAGYASFDIGLSQKAAERYAMYYELDGDAQRFLLFVDETLSDAESFAVEYVCAEGYMSKIYQNMPADVQAGINERFNAKKDTDGFNMEDFIAETLNRVYRFKAFNQLQERREQLFRALLEAKGDAPWQSPDIRVTGIGGIGEETDISSMKVKGTFFAANDFNYRLTVELDILPLIYHISYSEILVEGERDLSANHYDILRWDETYSNTAE